MGIYNRHILLEDFTQARDYFKELVEDKVKIRSKSGVDTNYNLMDGICVQLKNEQSLSYLKQYKPEIKSKVKVPYIDHDYWWPRTIKGNKQRVLFLNKIIKKLEETN